MVRVAAFVWHLPLDVRLLTALTLLLRHTKYSPVSQHAKSSHRPLPLFISNLVCMPPHLYSRIVPLDYDAVRDRVLANIFIFHTIHMWDGCGRSCFAKSRIKQHECSCSFHFIYLRWYFFYSAAVAAATRIARLLLTKFC